MSGTISALSLKPFHVMNSRGKNSAAATPAKIDTVKV